MAKAFIIRVEPEVTLTLSAGEASWLKSLMQNPLPLVPVPRSPSDRRLALFTIPESPEEENAPDRQHRSAIFEALNKIDELR